MNAVVVSSAGSAAVFGQASALLDALSIPREPGMTLIATLAHDGLNGPYRGRRRFSAINLDGFPFQWSVSLGIGRGALRFIADCGIPGQSIAERIAYTLERIAKVAPVIGVTKAIAPLFAALDCLLPVPAALDASLMGLCVGVELDPSGAAALKVYANTETGAPVDRFARVSNCQSGLGRSAAVRRLDALRQTLGDQLRPAYAAIDLAGEGIGRVKMYFRPIDGTPTLAALAAETAGAVDAAARLAPLHRAFLNGNAYPPSAVAISIEFPAAGDHVGCKVDLYTSQFLSSDRDVDRRMLSLLDELGFDHRPYEVVRDVVAGPLRADAIRFLLFAGLAIRGGSRQASIYLHPWPGETTN